MLFIASEKCLESSYWLWKSQRIKGPAWVKQKKREGEQQKRKKKGRGKGWMGLSLQISCTRMRFMQSYLLALPNIVWPRRSLSKQKRQQMSYCFPVMLGRTHHYRPPPGISADAWRNLPCVGSRISWSCDVCSPSPMLFPLLASYDSYAAFLECEIRVRDCTIAKSFITAQFSHSC